MQSYQLYINIKDNTEILIGKFGKFIFPKGDYIYTGSAKRNIDGRIKRHESESSDKKSHWHIDYLLNDENAKINKTEKFSDEECELNKRTCGEIIISGFGSSDCSNKCKSHLKYLG
ncbi:MAG: Uri superfamily endonuclease [Rickettsiales bacterium]|jgi:Uri superfamily endonuclease